MVDGFPGYVTACSKSDLVDGWRDRRIDGGVVINVPSKEIISTGFSMPHSGSNGFCGLSQNPAKIRLSGDRL